MGVVVGWWGEMEGRLKRGEGEWQPAHSAALPNLAASPCTQKRPAPGPPATSRQRSWVLALCECQPAGPALLLASLPPYLLNRSACYGHLLKRAQQRSCRHAPASAPASSLAETPLAPLPPHCSDPRGIEAIRRVADLEVVRPRAYKAGPL